MEELINMLRTMAASCRAISAHSEFRIGMGHAQQAVERGSLPGIRAGIGHNMMVRIVIERSNNDANSVASTAEASSWNSLWYDPEQRTDEQESGPRVRGGGS